MKTIEKKLLGVLFLAFAAGCGGGAAATGEEKLDPNTDISPVPSVQKRLVLDLSDAELLYRASNLGDSYLKRNQEDADGETTESPATETSTSATELVAVLLQKVTTDFKVKPALYLEREFKLNTLKNQETDADSATETSADIIPDDVVPPLGNVYTTATDTFIFFSYAFSYNSGNSCSLFRIKSRTALECADSVAVDVDNLKIDRAGNLYYEAVLEDKTVLRKRSAADGTLTDLATLDEATDNGFYDWEVMPSGMILARTDPRDVTEGALAVFKRISSAGEATISVPEEYDECGVQDDQRVLSTNGNLIFAGCHETADGGEESGIFSLSFDVGSVPTLLLSDNNEDSLIESLMGCSFRIDNEDHLWCSALLKGEGYNFTRLIRITPEPNLAPLMEYYDNWNSALSGPGNTIYNWRTTEFGMIATSLQSSAGTMQVTDLFTAENTQYVNDVFTGASGQIYFDTARGTDEERVLYFQDDTGAVVSKKAAILEDARIYSLSPIAD